MRLVGVIPGGVTMEISDDELEAINVATSHHLKGSCPGMCTPNALHSVMRRVSIETLALLASAEERDGLPTKEWS